MSAPSEADRAIAGIAERLETLKEALGDGYWRDEEVLELQASLKSLIGGYGAWAEDRPPMHQRSRHAARYESLCARLLWPR